MVFRGAKPPEDGLPVSAGPNIPSHSVHAAFKTALLSRNATMLLSADMQSSLSLFHFQCPLGCESQADPPTPAGSHGLQVSSPQGVYSPSGSPAYSAPFLALGEHPLGFCGQMRS